MKHLAEAYTSFFELYTTPARWLTANSVLAVKWLFDLRNLIDLRDADIFSSYMSALLSVMSHICASKKFVKIQNKMKTIFNHDLLIKALEWIRNHYITQSSSAVNILALLTLLPCSNEHFDFSFFVKIYTANILLAKHRPNIHVVVASSKIFKQMSLEMFRDEIMAIVKKSMLRSPEIAIFGYCFIFIMTVLVSGVLYLLESIRIDLSSFAIDFYKILSASLISSIDEVRKHTSLSVAVIAKKITDSKALKGLVDGVFGTYSGFQNTIFNNLFTKKEHEMRIANKLEKIRKKQT
ncbi:unnamed protein product [Onchocerca flexuosa]|uniref:Transmembrane protein n=1 Tax=Onchocerca flexuosa TaxID=387005 RepID=A0A183HZM2_9BILA|nr:unnamed protein product [Onchocerca flexuosa]